MTTSTIVRHVSAGHYIVEDCNAETWDVRAHPDYGVWIAACPTAYIVSDSLRDLKERLADGNGGVSATFHGSAPATDLAGV